MPTSSWTEADTKKAEQIWADYQKQHDVSGRRGQAVGIDPANQVTDFSNMVNRKQGAITKTAS